MRFSRWRENIRLWMGFVVGNLAKRRDCLKLKSSPGAAEPYPEGRHFRCAPIKDSQPILSGIFARKRTESTYLIGLGGVFTAEDAYEKIKAGASLVEIVTGLIYGGPTIVKKINEGLVELLARDGYRHVSEAVGAEVGK